MVEVRLHGELARDFGRVWHLDILRPAEAIRAIEANMPGIVQKIRELSRRGYVYRVRTCEHDYCNEDIDSALGRCKRVDFIPIIVGANAGVRFVVGSVLLTVGFFYNYSLFLSGASMVLGAASEMLTPKPQLSNRADKLTSWTISGPSKTAQQGAPVPVIYGEVLTGSVLISSGISAAPLTYTEAFTPTVAIGGERSVHDYVVGGGVYGAQARYSAGVHGLKDPLGYRWTVSGFDGVNVILAGATTATTTVQVDYGEVPAGVVRSFTGVLTLEVTGIEAEQGVTLTQSAEISFAIDTRYSRG